MSVTAECSDEWLDVIRKPAIGRLFGCGDLTVEYRCLNGTNELTHHQTFVDGQLVNWTAGAALEPDLCLRQPRSAHLSMLTRSGVANDVLAATEVIDLTTGASGWPPPLDEVRIDWARELPVIPTAGEVVVHQILTGSPFGDVSMFFKLNHGRLVDSGIGEGGAPDILVRRSYGLALGERDGSVDLLDSLEGGEVGGDFPKVTMFVGVYESPECVVARRRLTTRYCQPLVMLGEVLSSEEWSSLASRLERALSDSWSVP